MFQFVNGMPTTGFGEQLRKTTRRGTSKMLFFLSIKSEKLQQGVISRYNYTHHHHEWRNPGGSPSVMFFSHRIYGETDKEALNY